ncbi:inverse autotransporter beta-barrel domain-containing protein [Xenorhabdus beddingii]|uniref:Inverse autotransporter beta-barrel domain-containing protein n=1 Tax=Xenorhabdus beddingii TaxID=40578 RepID=A0A1Y2SM46_9GAMM|nr:Ig-like domain-containing protein [Xenorhabdus beddingii]OTA19145.1 inverse autotransporter beta-barrel domain-containing protein [Xenorhabdus beddingii]
MITKSVSSINEGGSVLPPTTSIEYSLVKIDDLIINQGFQIIITVNSTVNLPSSSTISVNNLNKISVVTTVPAQQDGSYQLPLVINKDNKRSGSCAIIFFVPQDTHVGDTVTFNIAPNVDPSQGAKYKCAVKNIDPNTLNLIVDNQYLQSPYDGTAQTKNGSTKVHTIIKDNTIQKTPLSNTPVFISSVHVNQLDFFELRDAAGLNPLNIIEFEGKKGVMVTSNSEGEIDFSVYAKESLSGGVQLTCIVPGVAQGYAHPIYAIYGGKPDFIHSTGAPSILGYYPPGNLTSDGEKNFIVTVDEYNDPAIGDVILFLVSTKNDPAKYTGQNKTIRDIKKDLGTPSIYVPYQIFEYNVESLFSYIIIRTSGDSLTSMSLPLTYMGEIIPNPIQNITVSPPSPILINDIYTLQINIKDATGQNSETNKKVNWIIKDSDQEGITLDPTNGTTDLNGDATTTLTSTQVRSVTVEASVEGVETPKSVDVEFKWPIIQKPTFTPKNKTVHPDGKEHYTFTAKVVGLDGVTPYTKQDVKFKWQLTLPKDAEPQKTWLSDTGQVTVNPDGSGLLQVDLYSSQTKSVVTGAEVCLFIVENALPIPSTKQCADPVDFKKTADTFEIKSLSVVGVDPSYPWSTFEPDGYPLSGDGQSYYLYTAKIVEAGTEAAPPDGTYINNAQWGMDLIANTYNGKPEWEITSDNQVKDGHITAKLSSQVGIGELKDDQITGGLTVTLTLPTGKESATSKKAEPVVFKTVPQKSGVFVYIKEADGKTIKKHKIFEDQLRPNNVFGKMYAQLYDLSIKKKILDEGGYVVDKSGFGGINDVGYIDINTGEIDLGNVVGLSGVQVAPASVTIKRTNQARYTYTYSFSPKNALEPYLPMGLVQKNSDGTLTCDNLGKYTRDANEFDVGINVNNDYSLTSEFPNSYSWGLLDSIEPAMTTFVGKYKNGERFIYDAEKDEIVDDENAKGYLLCLVSYTWRV